MCERVHDVRDHNARGIKADGRRAWVFEECGIKTVIDGRSNNDILRSRLQYVLFQIFRHQEVIVELNVASVFFRFGAKCDHDDGVRSQHAFGFVPRSRFEEHCGVCVRGYLGRGCSWRLRMNAQWHNPNKGG